MTLPYVARELVPVLVSEVLNFSFSISILMEKTEKKDKNEKNSHLLSFSPPKTKLPTTKRQEAQDLAEEEAARTLGASDWDVFWNVTLPHAKWFVSLFKLFSSIFNALVPRTRNRLFFLFFSTPFLGFLHLSKALVPLSIFLELRRLTFPSL